MNPNTQRCILLVSPSLAFGPFDTPADASDFHNQSGFAEALHVIPLTGVECGKGGRWKAAEKLPPFEEVLRKIRNEFYDYEGFEAFQRDVLALYGPGGRHDSYRKLLKSIFLRHRDLRMMDRYEETLSDFVKEI